MKNKQLNLYFSTSFSRNQNFTPSLPNFFQASMVHKQDSTSEFYCQLTKLAGFDDLLDKSHSEINEHDTRADDLTRRHSNKRPKTKSIQKAAERARGRTPKRLSGRLRDRSALDFSFSFVYGAGVCLSRRAQRADLYKTSTREGAKYINATDCCSTRRLDYDIV